MIDTDFIKKFVSFDRSIPFIERGETLPLELVEWLQGIPDEMHRITKLIVSDNQNKSPIYITLRCPECGESFVYPSSPGYLKYDVANRCQDYKTPLGNRIKRYASRLCPVCLDEFLRQLDELFLREKEEKRRKADELAAEIEKK